MHACGDDAHTAPKYLDRRMEGEREFRMELFSVMSRDRLVGGGIEHPTSEPGPSQPSYRPVQREAQDPKFVDSQRAAPRRL